MCLCFNFFIPDHHLHDDGDQVPAMIFTPISPHSLSFRPVILPSVARLTIKIAPESRGNAWVCYDGRRRFEVKPNDCVTVKMSRFPMPSTLFCFFDLPLI